MTKKSTKIAAYLDEYLAKFPDALNIDDPIELSNAQKYKSILNDCNGEEPYFFQQIHRKNLLSERIRKLSYRIAFELEKEKLPTEEDLKV